MTDYLLISLAIVASAWCAYGLVQAFVGAWRAYRGRLETLRRLETNPQLLESEPEIMETLDKGEGERTNYVVAGLALTGLSLACLVSGRVMGFGQVAVGLYLGGFLGVGIGILLVLLGLVILSIARRVQVLSHDSSGP
jgi:hypothetical protein